MLVSEIFKIIKNWNLYSDGVCKKFKEFKKYFPKNYLSCSNLKYFTKCFVMVPTKPGIPIKILIWEIKKKKLQILNFEQKFKKMEKLWILNSFYILSGK